MTARLFPRRRSVVALGFASLALLAACAESPATGTLPSGSMDVLGPIPAFEASALPRDWVIDGAVGRGQLTVVDRDGIPALMVVNGSRPFAAVKPIRSYLLATPYLSWAWNMETPATGTHPVRLVIGFSGGNGQQRDAAAAAPAPSASRPLPVHDREIAIIWGDSALQRGAIDTPDAAKQPQSPALYTARGGRENAGTWWLETVDLSDIYRRSWPADDAADVRITFIGVAALGGRPRSPAYVSGIRLSR